MYPPYNLLDNINIGTLPNLVQNESIYSFLTSNSTHFPKNPMLMPIPDNRTIVIDLEDYNQSSAYSHFHTSILKRMLKCYEQDTNGSKIEVQI